MKKEPLTYAEMQQVWEWYLYFCLAALILAPALALGGLSCQMKKDKSKTVQETTATR